MSWWVFNKKTKAVTEGINVNQLMTEIARGNVAGAFPEGSIVLMEVTTDKAAIVTGDWFGWLEDA